MSITKKEFNRIAESMKYIADDPAADHDTVVKMVQEFSNAASALNPTFDRAVFVGAVFGYDRRAVINGWSNTRIECGACGFDLFYSRGRSLDHFNWECGRCGHKTRTMTETGMSA